MNISVSEGVVNAGTSVRNNTSDINGMQADGGADFMAMLTNLVQSADGEINGDAGQNLMQCFDNMFMQPENSDLSLMQMFTQGQNQNFGDVSEILKLLGNQRVQADCSDVSDILTAINSLNADENTVIVNNQTENADASNPALVCEDKNNTVNQPVSDNKYVDENSKETTENIIINDINQNSYLPNINNSDDNNSEIPKIKNDITFIPNDDPKLYVQEGENSKDNNIGTKQTENQENVSENVSIPYEKLNSEEEVKDISENDNKIPSKKTDDNLLKSVQMNGMVYPTYIQNVNVSNDIDVNKVVTQDSTPINSLSDTTADTLKNTDIFVAKQNVLFDENSVNVQQNQYINNININHENAENIQMQDRDLTQNVVVNEPIEKNVVNQEVQTADNGLNQKFVVNEPIENNVVNQEVQTADNGLNQKFVASEPIENNVVNQEVQTANNGLNQKIVVNEPIENNIVNQGNTTDKSIESNSQFTDNTVNHANSMETDEQLNLNNINQKQNIVSEFNVKSDIKVNDENIQINNNNSVIHDNVSSSNEFVAPKYQYANTVNDDVQVVQNKSASKSISGIEDTKINSKNAEHPKTVSDNNDNVFANNITKQETNSSDQYSDSNFNKMNYSGNLKKSSKSETYAESNEIKQNVDVPNEQKSEKPANISEYFNSIRQIKKQLYSDSDKRTDTKDNQQITDIDTLQKQVSSFNFNKVAVSSKSIDSYESQSVFDQTINNISHNIKNGKDEFIVKLNPEGLGEITVKLVKEEGKMVLDMTASTVKTAAILNNRLGELQSTLKSYDAHINPVTVQRKDADNGPSSYNQQFDSFNGNQQNQHNHQFKNNHRNGNYFYYNDAEEDADNDGIENYYQYNMNAMLNTMI